MFPNTARSDKWKFLFSELPGSIGLDQRLLDNYVTTFTLPDFVVENVSTYYLGYEQPNMNPNRNSGLFPFTVTMKVSEGHENYFAFLVWWYKLRRGNIDITNDAPAPYMNFVPHCTAFLLDTQKRERVRFRLLDCILTSVSSLTGVVGSSDELEFTVSLTATDVEFDYIGVNDGQSGDDRVHPSEWDGFRTEVDGM